MTTLETWKAEAAERRAEHAARATARVFEFRRKFPRYATGTPEDERMAERFYGMGYLGPVTLEPGQMWGEE